MRRLPFLALCLTLAVSATSGQRNPVFSGTVVRIVSGDTMRVKVSAKGYPADGTEVGLRLWGIEAPKEGQPFAKEAKTRLSKLALKQKVIVEDWGHDKEGNVTGEVSLVLPAKWNERSYFTEIHGKTGPEQQIILNDEMLASGLATIAKSSGSVSLASTERRLTEALESAQKAKLGMWAK